MIISKHISYIEATSSFEAKRKQIENTPTEKQLEAMKYLADNIFEKIRVYFGVPIKINSFFRSEKLNKVIGGTSSSQHVLGEAIDLDDTFGGLTNTQIFNYIKNNLIFDQLIWEFGTDKSPDWVHVSLKKTGKNRGEILVAKKINGKTKYIPF
jgi:hypothetical protein